jgi:hypothetical protein
MNVQVFPNWGKKAGLFIFLIGAVVSFILGYHEGAYPSESPLLTPNQRDIFELLTLVGMLIYFLSKEKVEDDFIQKIRLDSYQLTIVICISLLLLTFLLFKDYKLPSINVLEIFLIIYLTVFYYKKRAF